MIPFRFRTLGKFTVKKIVPHHSRFKPIIRRKRSAGPNQVTLLQERMFPKHIVNGTDIERLVAKQVHDRGYGWGFQEKVRSAAFGFEALKMDVSVYNTGLAPVVNFECQGAYWHTDRQADELRRIQIEAEGIPTFFLWEADLLGDEDRMHYAIDQALQGIELPEP